MEKESKRLYRSETDQILGGVASGIADYLNIDPTIVRFLWVLVALLGGTGVFVYIVLWIIIPTPNQKDIPTKQVVEQNAKKNGRES
ncbi:MAG TPA: PspC domain-containing protein [Candidatus Dojkabacteria bacterium]|nr:PspC domain-containing protein [Candidatus Dojkabacteria bacterium]HQF36985.1 PspC domain-containing protein [Candidatus Dojkabacteria bacterium]